MARALHSSGAMPLLFTVALAFAGGGGDHTHPAEPAPAAPASTAGEAARVAATSAAHEAVLVVAPPRPDGEADITVLLADWATSAPVADGRVALSLNGPVAAAVDLAPAAPGTWAGHAALPPGEYAGPLVLDAGTASDILAISGLRVDGPAVAAPVVTEAAGARILVGGLVVGALAVGLFGGFLLGRRGQAAGAAVALLGLFGAERVSAHGGEDHGEPSAAATAPGATLTLQLESQFLLGLRTVPVVRDRFTDRASGFGHLVAAPAGAATLRAPVDGTLRAPPGGFPAPGAWVNAGELLATLSETPGAADRAEVALGTAEARVGLAEARERLRLAEADAAAIDAVGTAISGRERLALTEGVATAREALRQAEVAARAMEAGVAVRAPLAGRISRMDARAGEQVSAGDPLFHVVDPAGLRVELRVPEADAVRIVEGASALVRAAALPEAQMPAVVLDPGQEADPATGLVTVTLVVTADPLLRPGMAVTAWVEAGAARDVVVVPDAAVVEGGGAPVVYVKTGPESFAARPVSLGSRAGTTWEVRAGLAPGERVVTAATYPLQSLAGR